MTPPQPPTRSGKSQISVVKALYAYTGQRPDELSFQEGDCLYVLNKDDANWWKCRCNNVEGMVPSNYEAAKRGNLLFANELLDSGVSVNGLDKAGNTPLHWACRAGHIEVVRVLLQKQPALNAQNKLGDSALHLAAWGGHKIVVELLLMQKSVNARLLNLEMKSPLDLAKGDDTATALIQFLNNATEEENEMSEEE